MKAIETTGTDIEASWDSIGISRFDFRPHWNGDLVNLFSIVDRRDDESSTEQFMKECARSIAGWVGEHRKMFGPEDRFQVIIGWPTSVRTCERQTIKTGGSYSDLELLANGAQEIEMRPGWSVGVFTEETQANKSW